MMMMHGMVIVRRKMMMVVMLVDTVHCGTGSGQDRWGMEELTLGVLRQGRWRFEDQRFHHGPLGGTE